MHVFQQRVMMMTDPSEAIRRRALDEAEASFSLEGIVLDAADRAALEPFLTGQMTVEECVASIRARHGISTPE